MNALSISLHAFRRFVNSLFGFFFFNDTATTEIYTLSLHDALPIFGRREATLLHLALRGLGGAPALGLEQPDGGVQDGGVVHAVLLRRVRRAAVNRDQLGQGLPFARGEPRVRSLKIRWPIDIDDARHL